MVYIARFPIFILILLTLWSQHAEAIDVKIHINDIPRLILDRVNSEQDTAFRLGPADESQFYNYLERNSSRGRPGNFLLNWPYIIGPEYRGYTEKYWQILPEDSIAILLMHDYGAFEHVENIFVACKQRGDSLSLICVLDSAIWTALGIADLREASRVNDSTYLVICLTHGGDEGASGGSLILFAWSGSCFMKTLYKVHYSTQPCLWREVIDYDFDRDSLIVHITRKHDRVIDCIDDENQIYADSAIITTERVDIGKLLR